MGDAFEEYVSPDKNEKFEVNKYGIIDTTVNGKEVKFHVVCSG